MPLDDASNRRFDLDISRYLKTRENSLALANLFDREDWMLQSMVDASPIKWNLAHTSWFFEQFILKPFAESYEIFHKDYNFLFNSYYQQIGVMHPRGARGVLSRPLARDIIAYRSHIDHAIAKLIESASEETAVKIAPLIALGCAHEEQHQELLVTDITNAFSLSPLAPSVLHRQATEISQAPPIDVATDLGWVDFEGGIFEFGQKFEGFAFDNEGPRHQQALTPYRLATRLVTNREYLDFIEDGGYDSSVFWLADGWALRQEEDWRAPIYWRRRDGDWCSYSLFGEEKLDMQAPVSHLSFYEAAAYAEWTGYRLPTEFEWEHASASVSTDGHFLCGADFQTPKRAEPRKNQGEQSLSQMFGDLWEWTASPYVAYPGFRAPSGAIGEYNGKFMSSQMTLRGGSCATPQGHIRATYRNFFPPNARWQFSGLRLARDL